MFTRSVTADCLLGHEGELLTDKALSQHTKAVPLAGHKGSERLMLQRLRKLTVTVILSKCLFPWLSHLKATQITEHLLYNQFTRGSEKVSKSG